MPLYQYVQNKPVIRHESDKVRHKAVLDSISASLKGQDFSGEDHAMFELSGLTFEKVTLDRCQWTTANLAFTTFTDCSARFSNFAGACLEEAVMANSDLYGSNFLDAGCMTPHSFPGCNLSQSHFPTDYFGPPTVTANNLVKSLKSKGLFIITGCIIVALASLRMTDLEIFTNAGALTLPFTAIPVNCSIFFWLAPLALLWIHTYFHIVLNKFYSARLRLPNIYPNGLSMEHVCDPSIFVTLFRCKFQPTHVKPQPMNRGFQIAYIYTQFFFFTPAAILFVASRTISAQNCLMTVLTIAMAAWALGYAVWLITKTRAANYNVKPIYIKFSSILFVLIATSCLYQSRDHLIISKEEASKKLEGYKEDRDPRGQEKNVKGRDLSGRCFQNLQADEAFLPGSNLNQTSLRGANFKDAVMVGSSLVMADLSDARLDKTRLDKCDFTGADFSNVTLIDSNLTQAKHLDDIKNFPKSVTGTRFDGVDLLKWKLLSPKDNEHPMYSFSKCTFLESTLKEVKTEINATFSECYFLSAQLDGGLFEHCEFISTDMPSITASKTSFVCSQFKNVNLTGATLDGADFSQCQFEGGCYLSVDLTSCIFNFAEFKRVDFSGAKMNPEQLIYCTFDEGTIFPDSVFE